MLFLVSDLLDLFQIKNGKFKKNEVWVDLNQSFQSLIDMFRTGANEKKIEIIYECAPDLPSRLFVDEKRLK